MSINVQTNTVDEKARMNTIKFNSKVKVPDVPCPKRVITTLTTNTKPRRTKFASCVIEQGQVNTNASGVLAIADKDVSKVDVTINITILDLQNNRVIFEESSTGVVEFTTKVIQLDIDLDLSVSEQAKEGTKVMAPPEPAPEVSPAPDPEPVKPTSEPTEPEAPPSSPFTE